MTHHERMAAALKGQGYRYQYVYSRDAGHVDRAVVARTLPLALEWLWRDIHVERRPTLLVTP